MSEEKGEQTVEHEEELGFSHSPDINCNPLVLTPAFETNLSPAFA